jgi:TolB protein
MRGTVGRDGRVKNLESCSSGYGSFDLPACAPSRPPLSAATPRGYGRIPRCPRHPLGGTSYLGDGIGAAWLLGHGSRRRCGSGAARLGEPPKSSEVVLFLSSNQRPLLRLALPKFSDDASTAAVRQAAIDIEETLRADLQDSGVFQIQGPQDFAALSLSGELEQDADAYRGLGNEILLTATVKAEGARAVLEGRVTDLPSRQLILGKRYAGEPAWARRIAHTFADEIVREFTGQPGIALTQIAFSSDRSDYKEITMTPTVGTRPVCHHRSISLGRSGAAAATSGLCLVLRRQPGIYLANSPRAASTVGHGRCFNSSAGFSPDKAKSFARSLAGNVEIFLADADGGSLRRPTGIDTGWPEPRRAVDRLHLEPRQGSQIYVMDTDGTNVRRVTFRGTTTTARDGIPTTQPRLLHSAGQSFNLAPSTW